MSPWYRAWKEGHLVRSWEAWTACTVAEEEDIAVDMMMWVFLGTETGDRRMTR